MDFNLYSKKIHQFLSKIMIKIYNLPFYIRLCFFKSVKNKNNFIQKEIKNINLEEMKIIIEVLSTIKNICVKININYESSNIIKLLKKCVNFNLKTKEDFNFNEKFFIIIYKKPLRQEIFNLMLECGDFKYEKLTYIFNTEQLKEFELWLNEK